MTTDQATETQPRHIPVACNRASADFLISSPLLNEPGPGEDTED